MELTEQTKAVTSEWIKKLAEEKGPCITVVMPRGTEADFAHGKKRALNSAKASLEDFDVETAELLEPLEKFEPKPGNLGSYIVLRSPGICEVFATAEQLPESVVVGEHFQLRHLLALKDQQRPFYLLALAQGRTRLLHCTAESHEEVKLPDGTPESLNDSKQTRQPDHVLDNRSAGGPSMGQMGGVMFGTSSDADDKDEYLLHFFMQLDKGIRTLLKDSGEPLVVVAVEHELAEYKRVNTYPHLVEPGVHGAPDGLKGGEMHKRALELLRTYLPDNVRKALEDFDKLTGTGHASVHAQDIVKAAYEGRISHLFIRPDAEFTGTFDSTKHKVKRHSDRIEKPCDLLNAAAIETLLHGGSVCLIAAGKMPHGVPVAAVYRYPSPEAQLATAQSEQRESNS